MTWCFTVSMCEKKDCNTNRRDNVARFSGNGLRKTTPKHELDCKTHVNTLFKTMMSTWKVLQQNTTEFWVGTIIADVKSLHKSGLALMKEPLFLIQLNQWLGVLGDTYGMKMISLSNHRILHTCMTDLGWFWRKQINFFRIHDGNLYQLHVNGEEVTSYT